eukprot:TRINITY_DN3932_c0_g1_i2.p1 TRINITY_DN3932_c0_g1~~TRINITY_DN3932_c0_g1_i2.p1  ORF type:complete len:539 (+),score=146.37 TRINITY_DN3932_c0_g1_i2:58-1617(+)
MSNNTATTPAGAPARMTRDDFRKQKQLEEARKAGTAPAAVDDEGNEINPHIPQYIAQAPWYLHKDGPSLKHQRAFNAKEVSADWYQRGAIAAPAATKFRKGACTNCGAMSHTAKNCCERPRKIGAKWTGKNIQADEVVQELQLDYDGKRDRWNGYDPAAYEAVMEQYDKVDQERRKQKKAKEMQSFMTEPDAAHKRFPSANDKEGAKKVDKLVDSDSDSDSDVEDDEDFKDNPETALGVKADAKTRTTVRNLRIREDTAKYLRNLDPDSAYYDPKSRSMRDNPNPNGKNDALYNGDNFVRQSGDVNKFDQMMSYAWQNGERGAANVHLQAAPSAAELQFREDTKKKESSTKQIKESILARYGGAEHLNNPLDQVAATEEYVEYTPDGALRPSKGGKIAGVPRSRYPEDVFPGNHKSVWGSYWENGQWGFACCHQFHKNAYCTGAAGIAAKEEFLKKNQEIKEPANVAKVTKAKGGQEEKDERKRSYNSFSGNAVDVTKEEMEAYMQKKKRFDDPMKNYV